MINYEFLSGDASKIKTDLFVVGCKKLSGEKERPGTLIKQDGGTEIDKALGSALTKIINDEKLTGELCERKIVHTHCKIAAKNVLIIGTGEEKEYSPDAARKLGAAISAAANAIKAGDVAGIVQNEKIRGFTPQERIQALAEGFALGSYRFDPYKTNGKDKKPTLKTVKVICGKDKALITKAVMDGSLVAEAICFARDLVNMPGRDLTPDRLAKEAEKVCKKAKLSCTVMDEKGIKKERMNLILAVAEGSANPPRFIHMRYKPSKKAKGTIAIVGKGVTFDSGGYNLKSGKNMDAMKTDMGGAASVLGLMKLLPLLKPNVIIDAYIPSSENMIDGKAHKPGDIIKSRSGKTIEIDNTDAEGRLLLADAFDYAIEKKPDILIDLATLTGGVLYALGEIYTALLGNDQKLIDKLLAAAKEGGEPTWQLPLEKEYLKGYKESIADLKNSGKSYAGTIGASVFLHEFVGKTKWAHFDIAESNYSKEDRGYISKGGTGTGIQTLIKFLGKY